MISFLFLNIMCGIVGYVGSKSVDSVLLVGLQKLEYRGYDSAGIAVLNDNEITIEKAKGRIADLEEKLKSRKLVGNVGIGHTRWATHGEPSRRNAHPHTNQSGSVAVVQNGIIENYLTLKQRLTSEGYIFTSETDTEVLPHLIDHYLKETGDIAEAFQKTLRDIDGKYAISMVYEGQPGRIYFARKGAPLIIASGEGSFGKKDLFLASDVPAFVPIADHAYVLQDGQWGYINEDYHIFNYEGESVQIELEPVSLDEVDISKGDFEHFMMKEIFEQPGIIEKILDFRITDDNRVHFEEMGLEPEFLSKVGRVLIQACGTSLNAGLNAKLFFETMAKTQTDADFSSEFRYRNPVAEGDTLVVGISQSGETADTLAGIHEAKAKFLKVLSLVNNVNSSIARESNGIIDLMAGPEIGVASTKAYTAQLINLFLFALYLSDIRWMLPVEERLRFVEEMRALPDKMRSILRNIEPIEKIARTLKEKSSALFLGRTFNYPTALEGALKLKEISYIHAEGYAAGEFKHGPIALVSPEVPVIVVAPSGNMRMKMLSNLQEVKARNGEVIAVVSEGDSEISEMADHVIEIPEVCEELSPILAVLPLQLLSYYTALERGCDVDKPRNLAKSVTVE